MPKAEEPRYNKKSKIYDRSKVRVCPWLNKAEFTQVYDSLFAEPTSIEKRKWALARLMVWKVRLGSQASAFILSTLAILEAELKDQLDETSVVKLNDYRNVYASAFTRFVNYTYSSIHNNGINTMYNTAKAVGLETFLVELRHMCAHGQTMPSIDVFRRTSTYCMDWLRKFYWQELLATVEDVKSLHNVSEIESEMLHLFRVFDTVQEALHKNHTKIEDLVDCFSAPIIESVQIFANQSSEATLQQVQPRIVYKIVHLAKTILSKDVPELLSQALLESEYFLEAPADCEDSVEDIEHLRRVYQTIFRALAKLGSIETCYRALIAKCNNAEAPVKARKSACFWANEIIESRVMLSKLRVLYKLVKDQNFAIDLKLESLNANKLPRSMMVLLKRLNAFDTQNLIFTDTVDRPWQLRFNTKYFTDVILNVTQFSQKPIISSLALAQPPMSEMQQNKLRQLIAIHISTSGERISKETAIYTVGKDIIPRKSSVGKLDHFYSVENTGPWVIATENASVWSKCPLGMLPWQ